MSGTDNVRGGINGLAVDGTMGQHDAIVDKLRLKTDQNSDWSQPGRWEGGALRRRQRDAVVSALFALDELANPLGRLPDQ